MTIINNCGGCSRVGMDLSGYVKTTECPRQTKNSPTPLLRHVRQESGAKVKVNYQIGDESTELNNVAILKKNGLKEILKFG